MNYWGNIELLYDDETLDHIAKHNVTIEEVLHVLRYSKKLVTRLKDENYAVIGEYYGRCLVLIVTRKEGNRFILRTARDCSEGEKKRYKKSVKK